jgi:hypothetical protein
MSALTPFLPLERRTLAADALLIAAAVGGAALGLVTLLSELVPDAGWYEPASVAVMVAVVLICPWVAWRLHGRRTSRSTVPGAAVGVLFAGLVVLATTWVVGGIALAVSWVTGDAVSMGVTAFVVTALAVLALVVWLDTDAVRDLARARHHVRLDVGRIAATVVALGTTAVALWRAARHPGEEPAELLAFALAFGVGAATVALGADLSA